LWVLLRLLRELLLVGINLLLGLREKARFSFTFFKGLLQDSRSWVDFRSEVVVSILTLKFSLWFPREWRSVTAFTIGFLLVVTYLDLFLVFCYSLLWLKDCLNDTSLSRFSVSSVNFLYFSVTEKSKFVIASLNAFVHTWKFCIIPLSYSAIAVAIYKSTYPIRCMFLSMAAN